MSKAARKVVLITNIPNPYRVPLFNELHAQLDSLGVSLLVVFGAMGYERRKFELDMSDCDFTYTVLPTRKIRYKDREKTSFTYSGLWSLIKKEKPDLIVTNAFSIATLKLWLGSWVLRTPYIIWSGAIHSRADRISFPRRLQRRLLVARAAGFIAYGDLARKYLVTLGARQEDVSIGINTVDTEFYREETNRLRSAGDADRESKTLLCITYLEPRKQIESLLYILKHLSTLRDDVRLVILGDGSERENLQRLADDLGVTRFVSFEGFVQKSDIPRYMARADVFLFPTRFDIWGLVLVEAMAAGLPCIASVNAGATQDLVIDGVTGFAAEFNDAVYIAEKVNWLLENPKKASRIGAAAAQMIRSDVSLEKSANGFVNGIMRALNGVTG